MNDVDASPTSKQIFEVALASIIGSVIEQYDFLVTGVIAATVWGNVFFKLPGLAAVRAVPPGLPKTFSINPAARSRRPTCRRARCARCPWRCWWTRT